MDDIIEPGINFDFSQLSLAQPIAIQGGAYFTKILNQGKPLYLQTPKISSKQGFVKSGKKIHCDIVFDNNDEAFIDWIENLETTCQNLIFKNSDAWFQNAMDLNDIESAFNPVLKSYKAGKKYLARTNVKTNSLTGSPVIKIYNENETPLTIDDVNSDTNIICILEVQGIKFTTRNFQIEIEVKQVMVLNTDKIFETCVIKKKTQPIDTSFAPSALERTLEKETSHTIISNNILSELEQEEEQKLESFEPNIELDTETSDEKESETEKNAETNNEKETENQKTLEKDSTIEEEIKIQVATEPLVEITKENSAPFELEEWNDFSISNSQNLETITLKKPNQVYYDLYKKAREKAKQVKKEALLAYLEAKNIKKTYMLEIDSSDDSDFDEDDDDEENEDDEEQDEEESNV